jgi:hypothetical protein
VSRSEICVGDLVKAKEITRDQVLAAVATIFDGQTAVSVSDAYVLILPDLAKMTPFSREAIMSALIEGKARKEKPACQVRRLSVARLTHSVAGHDKILP